MAARALEMLVKASLLLPLTLVIRAVMVAAGEKKATEIAGCFSSVATWALLSQATWLVKAMAAS
jgi:hypothetical protein